MMEKPTQQQLILESKSKRIVVLACPGSGKTTTLTKKIVNLNKNEGISVKRMLSVTFTRKAAAEMLDRIKTQIAISDSEKRNICTLHSFGSRLLFKYKDLAGLDQDYSITAKSDEIEIVKTILPPESCNVFTIESFLAYVSRIKNGKETGSDGVCNKENFDKYCAAMREMNLIDVDDLVYLPVQILSSNETVRREVASRIDYLFVDEYQDINEIQDRFLDLLIRDETHVMLVGDDDQSIYEFRGSKSDFILNKSKEGSGYDVYFLTTNYRSQSPIVDFSKVILKTIHSSDRRDKEIIAAKGSSKQKPLRHMPFSSKEEEVQYVAEEIKRLITDSSVSPSEIAVLSRYSYGNPYHTELSAIASLLKEWGIPVHSGGTNSAGSGDGKAIKTLCGILHGLHKGVFKPNSLNLVEPNTYQEKNFAAVIDEINAKCGTSFSPEGDFVSLMEGIKEANPQLDGKYRIRLDRYLRTYEFLQEGHQSIQSGERPSEMILRILGYYEERGEVPEAIRNLYENAYSFAFSCENTIGEEKGGDRFSEVVANLNAFLASEKPDETAKGVHFLTAHQSKGLQFDVVFVVGLEAGSFPSTAEELDEEEMDNERRLFYVCVTRARELLYLTATGVATDPKAKDLASKTFIYNVPDIYFAEALPKLDDVSFTQTDSENWEKLRKKDEVIQELENAYDLAVEKVKVANQKLSELEKNSELASEMKSLLSKEKKKTEDLLAEAKNKQGVIDNLNARVSGLQTAMKDLESRFRSQNASAQKEMQREHEKEVNAIRQQLSIEEARRADAEKLLAQQKKQLAEAKNREEEAQRAIESAKESINSAKRIKSQVENAYESLLAYPDDMLPPPTKKILTDIYRVFVGQARYALLKQPISAAISNFQELVYPCQRYRLGLMDQKVFSSYIRSYNFKGSLDIVVRGILAYFINADPSEITIGAFLNVAKGAWGSKKYLAILDELRKRYFDLRSRKSLVSNLEKLNAITSSSSHPGEIDKKDDFAVRYAQLWKEFVLQKDQTIEVLSSYFVFIHLFFSDLDLFAFVRTV